MLNVIANSLPVVVRDQGVIPIQLKKFPTGVCEHNLVINGVFLFGELFEQCAI